MREEIRAVINGQISITNLKPTRRAKVKARGPLRPPIREDAQLDSPWLLSSCPACTFCGAYDHVTERHRLVAKRHKLTHVKKQREVIDLIKDARRAKKSLATSCAEMHVLVTKINQLASSILATALTRA